MINTLEDLNNKVMLIVNRMINRGCQETTTGNYIFSYNDVSEFISYEDYLLYQHLYMRRFYPGRKLQISTTVMSLMIFAFGLIGVLIINHGKKKLTR